MAKCVQIVNIPPGLSAGRLLFSSGATPAPPQDKEGKYCRTYHITFLKTILYFNLTYSFYLGQINFYTRVEIEVEIMEMFLCFGNCNNMSSCSVAQSQIAKNTIATSMARSSTRRVQHLTPLQPKSKAPVYRDHFLPLMNHVHHSTFSSDHQ